MHVLLLFNLVGASFEFIIVNAKPSRSKNHQIDLHESQKKRKTTTDSNLAPETIYSTWLLLGVSAQKPRSRHLPGCSKSTIPSASALPFRARAKTYARGEKKLAGGQRAGGW